MNKKLITSFVFILFTAAGLWAGGWNNTLMGCRAIALGAAFVGVADDPSAIYYNPAGLVFQRERLNISINGFYVMPTHEYIGIPGSRIQSKFSGSIPQIFFSYKVSDRLTIGFGAYAPFATGGVDWKKGQFEYPLKSYLGIFSLTPAVSYQVSKKLSLGFNINIYKALLEFDSEMDPYGPIKAEESGSAISGGLGLLFKPTERISIGLSIRGAAKMKLSGKTSVSTTVPELGTFDIKLKSETRFNLPWDIEIGASYRISGNFLISASAQYTIWSTLDRVQKTIGDFETYEEMNFKNILIARIGGEFYLPSGLFLRGGVGIDRAASPVEALSIDNIDVDKFTLLGGIGYRVGRMQIDFAYVHAQGKEREKTTFPHPGKYNLNATIIGLGLTFSF